MDFESLYDDFFSGTGDFFSSIADIFTDDPVELPEVVEPPAMSSEVSSELVQEPPQADLGSMIKTEFAKGEESFLDWLSKRPDKEKMQIGLFLVGGAKEALAASKQKGLIDQRNSELNQNREDKIRRGSVAKMPPSMFASAPLKGGLVDSAG